MMLSRVQHVTKAQSISFGEDRLLKCFKRRRNHFFRIPNTPSMSFRTDSIIEDHFIVGLPGKPLLIGNAKTGLHPKIKTLMKDFLHTFRMHHTHPSLVLN
jgi:hypothetical protein